MEIVSYNDRVSNMHKPDDQDKQIRLARNYMTRLKRRLVQAPNLEEKLDMNLAIKNADQVHRQLLLNYFVLEDILKERALVIPG